MEAGGRAGLPRGGAPRAAPGPTGGRGRGASRSGGARLSAELSYCAELVRNAARDRYLATLFAPAAAREALFALYAFDHEIGKVRHLVSQPIAGLIRLQWWRDALDATASGRSPAHPVAQAIGGVLRAAAGSRGRLDAAIDARERELEDLPPADLEALERELEGSAATIVQSALLILGATDPSTLEVGRKVGLAVGLADRLRALDADRRRARLRLPVAELAREGIELDAALGEPKLEPVIRRLAARGLEHLGAARAGRSSVPAAALPALLPGTLAGESLRRARKTGSSAAMDDPSPAAPLRLLWRHARRRF
ncbi:MAG TPA: squalene/phytoene synthase family protein [Geminicoccaceae bacterium]|nr:squalene/phytoene synthase family protein [Geminicoccaceae bacterium]